MRGAGEGGAGGVDAPRSVRERRTVAPSGQPMTVRRGMVKARWGWQNEPPNDPASQPTRPVAVTDRRFDVDYDKKLEELRVKVAEVQAATKAAATETHDQIQERIGEAQAKIDKGMNAAKADAQQTGDKAKSRFAQAQADASARVAQAKRDIDRRGDQFDANIAESDADWAESDAVAAIDFADWAVDQARVAILDAIDARIYAQQKASAVRM